MRKGNAAQLPNLDTSVHQLIDATVAVPSRLLRWSPFTISYLFLLHTHLSIPKYTNCSSTRCNEIRRLCGRCQMVRLNNSLPEGRNAHAYSRLRCLFSHIFEQLKFKASRPFRPKVSSAPLYQSAFVPRHHYSNLMQPDFCHISRHDELS